MILVGYVHSKITEALFKSYVKECGVVNFFAIYGRGYVGSDMPSMSIGSDRNDSPDFLLLLSYRFSRLCNEWSGGVKLMIPHFNNHCIRLIAAHKNVLDVVYFEEGSLTWSDKCVITDEPAPSGFNSKKLGEYFDEIQRLGYDLNLYDLVSPRYDVWFTNAGHKFSGVVCTGDHAFRQFPGSRVECRLEVLAPFKDKSKVALLLISYHSVTVTWLRSVVGRNHMPVCADISQMAMQLYRDIFEKLLEIYKSAGFEYVFVKCHPSMTDAERDFIVGSPYERFLLWENTEMPQLSSDYELGCIAFGRLGAIGDTSTLMYARISGAVPDHCVDVIDDQVIESDFLMRYRSLLSEN